MDKNVNLGLGMGYLQALGVAHIAYKDGKPYLKPDHEGIAAMASMSRKELEDAGVPKLLIDEVFQEG